MDFPEINMLVVGKVDVEYFFNKTSANYVSVDYSQDVSWLADLYQLLKCEEKYYENQE